VVDHRRQRRRLARAGGAGHQHHAARIVGDFLEDFGRLEVLERQNLGGYGAHDRRGAALLHERVDAEACKIRYRERKIALQVFLVKLALSVVHDVVHHAVDVLVLHRWQIDPPHVAMHADHRRQSGRQVQIRCLVLDHKCEQLGDVHYNFLVSAGG